nr:retrovirus-related Pol polyprotein from transposon TNT 1-94 [Tanacetum cinerariifolium]
MKMASASPICLMARASSTKSWLWHQRLSHLNFDTINDLARNDLVAGLPKFKYHKEHLCSLCEQGKSKRASHPPKPVPNMRQRLHLLHIDLCGPMRIASINGKRYVLVIVDDYSRYTWVHFLRSKDEAPEVIIKFLKRITVLLQIRKWCCSLIPAESDSLPYAHAQTTKTYYKHQDSRIMKAQESKTKTSANFDIQRSSFKILYLKTTKDLKLAIVSLVKYGSPLIDKKTIRGFKEGLSKELRPEKRRDRIIYDLNKTPELFQEPPQNCPKCENPVDGQYCQGCTLLRKKFKEDLFTYCIENGILQGLLDTFEPSNDNTNVVNALQEPFVVKQDPGENSSQSPPHINHHCCYECGDSLEDIFCHQCTCESCGKRAHYGYNCQPKVPIIPNPKPYNNQTIDELPQTLPSFDPACYSGDGNSITYDSNSHFFPVIHQPIYEKTCVELLAEEQETNINTQPFQYSIVHQPPREEISVEFLQEKRNQIDSVKTFLRTFNRISFYEMPKVLSLAWETILEIEHALEDKHCQPEDVLELFRRLHNDVQNIHEELAVYINTLSWDRPTICYSDHDDENCTIAITPIISTEELDNSLSMGDEHLDTILKTKSDKFIKSSVENLVPIPSESEGIPDNICDLPFHDNSSPLNVSKDQFEDFYDSNDDSTSINDDSFSIDNIEYVEASPPDSERLGQSIKDNPTPYFDFMTKSSSTSLNFLLEETNTFDNSLPESKTFCFDLEEISSGSTITRSDISLPDYEAYYDDHVKEISSGSTTTHSDFSLYDSFIFDLSINSFPPADRSDFYHEEFADELAHIISPPEYDYFCFKNEPNSGDFTMDVVEDTFPTREPRVHVHNILPTNPNLQLNLDFILFRIKIPFLISASPVIISLLLCQMYLIGVELS